MSVTKKIINIALVGNPNCGKSTIFNQLTGLNQKIGNFAGVTVDKRIGSFDFQDTRINVIDLPGTYSLYPKSLDEQVVLDYLFNKSDSNYPNLIVVVADASNLKRNLLLLTQIVDWGLPTILALNMIDVADKIGLKIDPHKLSEYTGVSVVPINGRTGEGIKSLKEKMLETTTLPKNNFVQPFDYHKNIVQGVNKRFNLQNHYQALVLAHQFRKKISILTKEDKDYIQQLVELEDFQSSVLQINETSARYNKIDTIVKDCCKNQEVDNNIFFKLDKIFLHPFWGYLVFLLIMFLVFQSIFHWASLPMDLIDKGIAIFNQFLKQQLPDGILTQMLTEGIIAGLGGILIFIPQIAILFLFISILEETGYMTRVMIIMDQLMRKFGMNGRSVVPLISGVACAVPAIIATRSIDDWKSRLVTIMVTPLMSCSARLPVFTILIALVIPNTNILGFVNLQGLILMVLYLLGMFSALVVGAILSKVINHSQKSFFIMELPSYKVPRWKNIGFTIIEKIKTFVFEAGKVIIAIAIILWVLANFGPNNAIQQAEQKIKMEQNFQNLKPDAADALLATARLEASYAGYFGKLIEPAIKPLGFDWKIGVALITSFAAREVFIGTMSTIYSVGSDQPETVKEKMSKEINPKTGKKMYTLALGLSLLVFYVFAMQCMSTLAVVYRETKSWKWPLVQFLYMSALAYSSSFFVYQLFSN